jgi:hypothetical protein
MKKPKKPMLTALGIVIGIALIALGLMVQKPKGSSEVAPVSPPPQQSAAPAIYYPPLGRDLPEDMDTARAEFNRRVAAAFPIGSDTNVLTQALANQGFTVNVTDATYHAANGPCTLDWQVVWAEVGGKLSQASGNYQRTCQ